jgi:hypothetical protein
MYSRNIGTVAVAAFACLRPDHRHEPCVKHSRHPVIAKEYSACLTGWRLSSGMCVPDQGDADTDMPNTTCCVLYKVIAMNTTFGGFPKEMFSFLADLSANNNREWFSNNKRRYESFVVAPVTSFIEGVFKLLRETARGKPEAPAQGI